MMYEVFTGKELRTCKRIFTKMVEYGHGLDKFIAIVDHLRADETRRRALGLPAHLVLKIPMLPAEYSAEETLAAIGWRQLRIWMKMGTLLTKKGLDEGKVKEFIKIARRLEWENTKYGFVKGG